MWNELSNEFYFVATVCLPRALESLSHTRQRNQNPEHTGLCHTREESFNRIQYTHVCELISFSFAHLRHPYRLPKLAKRISNGWLISHTVRTHFACPKTIANRISGLLNLLRWIFILSCQYKNVPIAKCFCSCFFYWPITSIKVNASHEDRYPIQEVEIEFGVGKIGDWLIRNCCCRPKYPTAIKSIHGYGAICNHFDRKEH